MMDKKNLVQLCKAGDEEAIAMLYTTYRSQLVSVCAKYVSDPSVCEDLFHDSFIIILTSLAHLQDTEKVGVWMKSIVKNYTLKYLRQERRFAYEPLENHKDVTEEPPVDIKQYDQVMQVVESLPEGYRRVFRMAVFEGMSHKEIAAELGIEPHTSSSQLTKAKRMMRKLLKDYGVWVLLLLLAVSLYEVVPFKSRRQTDSVANLKTRVEKKDVVAPSVASESRQLPVQKIGNMWHSMAENIADLGETEMESIEQDTVNVESPEATDSTIVVYPADLGNQPKGYREMAQVVAPHREKHAESRWAVSLKYGNIGQHTNQTGLKAQFLNPYYGKSEMDVLMAKVPLYMNSWSEYSCYLASHGNDFDDKVEWMSLRSVAMSNVNSPLPINKSVHHEIPVTIQMAFDRFLTPRLSIGLGLGYTWLKSNFEYTGESASSITEKQSIDYLGIPLHLNYHLLAKYGVDLYTGAGVMYEIPVKTSLRTNHWIGTEDIFHKSNSLSTPCQWSISVCLGLQYNLTRHVGLYAEPGMGYFIPTGSNVETYRTKHPFTFEIPFGLRLSW